MKTIVTSGGKYSDIDTLACGIAYKELLELQQVPCELILPGPLNESVSKTVKSWNLKFKSSLDKDTDKYSFVLVDISDPTYFASFVQQQNIKEVYDHRWGFEQMWKEKLGNSSHIEAVGSCATLIWEQYKAKDLDSKLSKLSANLLYTAILSNTLNFFAQITTKRDIDAANELLKYSEMPSDWKRLYFHEIEESLMANPLNALQNDTKETFINGEKYTIGQLEMWDNTVFLDKNKGALEEALTRQQNPNSFITLPCISRGTNTIFCNNNALKEKLGKVIKAKFIQNIGHTEKLWLRKEIMRELAKS